MIINFKDAEPEKIWNGLVSRNLPPEIQKTALRKLRIINNASLLSDLAVPPNHHLEALKRDRQGQHSITADTDLRLARYFNMSEGFWLGVQADYDLMQHRRRIAAELAQITPHLVA